MLRLLKKTSFFFLLFLCSAGTGMTYSQSVVQLQQTGKKINLLANALYYEDKTGNSTLEDIKNSGGLTPVNRKYIQKGFITSAIWLQFSVQNNDDRQWLIELDNKELDSAELYAIKDGVLIQVIRQGDFIRPGDDKTKDFFPLFYLTIPKGESLSYYLRVRSSSAVHFNCTAWAETSYLKYLNIRDKMLWLFMGILALRLIYILVLHRFVKEKPFTIYTWVNVILFIGVVCNSVNLKAVSIPPVAANYLLNIFYWLVPMALAAWVLGVLKQYNHPRLTTKVIYIIWITGAAGIIAGLFFIGLSNFHFISNIYLQVVLAFLLFSTASLLWNRKAAPAVFIIPGMFLIFNQFHYSLINLNIYPFSMLVLIIISALFTTEVITMSLLLGNILKKSLRKNLETTERLHQVRDKISADLHDELGSVLTQISLQSEMVNSGIYSEKEKQKELQNISDTSRRAIHAMSDIVWSVRPEHDKVANLTDRMRDHAGLMLEPLNTELDFTVYGMDEEKEIDNTLRQELFLIFKEAINNIVKHSRPSGVEIKMGNRNGQFEMLIRNDTRLRKEKNTGGGNGIKNMQRRAAAIRAVLETKQNETSFELCLRRESI